MFSIGASSTPGTGKPEFANMEEGELKGGIRVSLKFSCFLELITFFLLNPVCMPIYTEVRKYYVLLWISISLEPISSNLASNTGASLLSEEHTELPLELLQNPSQQMFQKPT